MPNYKVKMTIYYEFEYGDKTFQVGIYEGDKVISILEEE